MAISNTKYFNFPIHLLSGFMENPNICLNNIMDYAIYYTSLKITAPTETEKIIKAASVFDIKLNNAKRTLANGRKIYIETPSNSPLVGLNITIAFDFYKNEKTEFEKVCLLGFLAIKSIVQLKAYCSITNRFWLARMAGYSKSCDFSQLPESLIKFGNEYQTKKIKFELVENWGLVTYSRFMKGFYVSFKINLDTLVYEAEKRRKNIKQKQLKQKENEALQKAMLRLQI